MKARVVTAVLAIPVVLGAVFYEHPIPFMCLAGVALLIGLWELGKLCGGKYVPFVLPAFWIGDYVVSASPFFGQYASVARLGIYLGIFAIAALLLGLMLRYQKGWLAAEFGSLWLVLPLLAMVSLHDAGRFTAPIIAARTMGGPLPPASAWLFTNPVLLVLLPLWAGDTAGIFVGMKFGKHKLAPAISPKKTVEGAIGNLVACLLVGTVVGVWLSPKLNLGNPVWWLGPSCGLIAGTLGQAGDLFESWIKRKSEVKDSGGLLPGHGGLLDRIDSLLFTAIPVTLIVSVVALSHA